MFSKGFHRTSSIFPMDWNSLTANIDMNRQTTKENWNHQSGCRRPRDALGALDALDAIDASDLVPNNCVLLEVTRLFFKSLFPLPKLSRFLLLLTSFFWIFKFAFEKRKIILVSLKYSHYATGKSGLEHSPKIRKGTQTYLVTYSICLSVCLSICLSVCLSVCLPEWMFVWRLFCLFLGFVRPRFNVTLTS